MRFRSLIHIPRGTARLLLLTLVAAIALFFAATRTEVGRDVLRAELERRFGNQFEGSLRIGTLTGNLVYRLTALDVELRDPDGAAVLAIDSLVVQPRWRRVLGGRLEVGRLHIAGLDARLHRDGTGYWNIARALTPRSAADTTSPRMEAISVGDLRITNSSITTSSSAEPPAPVRTGVLFDYENSRAVIRQARAIVDWRPTDAQIDLVNLSVSLNERQFDILESEGQIVFNDNTILVNQASVVTAASTIKARGSVDDRRSANPDMDISVSAEPIDHTEFSRLFPRSPFRNETSLSVKVHGPLSGLVIEEVALGRRASRIRLEGTVVGLPDSADFEISVPEAFVTRRDLRTVLSNPTWLGHTNLDSLELSMLTRGVIHDPRGVAHGSGEVFLDATADSGRLSGRIRASRDTAGTLAASSDLFVGSLRLEEATTVVSEPTRLTGDVSLAVTGMDPREMIASAEATFVSSSFWGRQIDSLRLVGKIEGGILTLESEIVNAGGALDGRVVADYSESPSRIVTDIRTREFDFGPVLAADSLKSSISGHWTTRLRLTGVDDVVGDMRIRFDSSRVDVPGRYHTITPGVLELVVDRPETGIVSVALDGDILEGRVDVRGSLSDAYGISLGWLDFVNRSLAGDSLESAHLAVSGADRPRTPSVTISGTVSVLNSETLGSFVPYSPSVRTSVTSDFAVNLDPTVASIRLGVDGDSLAVGGIRSDAYSGSLFLSANAQESLLESLTVSGSLNSTRFSAGGSGVPDIGLTLSYRNDSGQITITSREGERVGPLDVVAALSLRGDVITVMPAKLDVRAGGYDWTLAQPSDIVVSSKSAETGGLAVETVMTPEGPTQRVEFRGRYSNRPGDRLLIITDRLDLEQFSRILSLRAAISGQLDGTFALSRQNDTPIVEAEARVAALGLDDRILGDLSISSELRPGASDGQMNLRIGPSTQVPEGVNRVENEATITGTFRLPSYNADGVRTDPGELDLTATVTRADLFFFDYIFTNTLDDITGFVAGTIRIGGSLPRPVFDSDLKIVDGRFTVPQFNLGMSLTADVRSDRNGIYVRRADFVDKSGGTVTLTGDILFNEYRFFSFNLQGLLDRFQIMDVASSRDLPFYGHIWASGTATLVGPLNETLLSATNARTTPDSELYIPLVESQESSDAGFIVFADSSGQMPDLTTLTRRRNLLAKRPTGERAFVDGMNMELNIDAPPGSTVHLVIDPLLGDVINAVGSGRVQILRNQGEFNTFGTFDVVSGDYLFTAGEVFVRRFVIEEGGIITWDGDPADARLDIPAAFRTRASRAGLQASAEGSASLIPVVVNLTITGRVSAPEVALALNIDRSSQTISSTSDQEFLETILNNQQLSAEYATSVLLTNSFALTTTSTSSGEALGSGAFNSLSQLIAAQLNRYLSTALPNVDFSFGVQGQTSQELDITYGVALRLLDQRLVIRGQGVYQGAEASAAESLQGEFVVEVRLSNNVSVEVFYRREGDLLVRTLTSTTGAGLSYKTEFPTWKRFLNRLFGWMRPNRASVPAPPDDVTATTEAI